MGKILYGLKSLKMGAIAVDGGMGTALTDLGGTLEGSATLITEDGESTKISTEESDTPVIQFNTPGETRVVFDILDMDPANLVRVLGGEVTGTGDAAVYKSPSGGVDIEQSLEIVTKNNFKWEFPRVKVTGKLNANLSKKDVYKVTVTCVVLKPTKTGVSPFSYSKVS